MSYPNIHLILPSKINKAINNNKTINMILSVLEMISTGNINSRYMLSDANITFEEELCIKKYFNIDIYSYTSGMMVNNYRFIFFADQEDLYCEVGPVHVPFYNILYSTKSSLNDDGVNNFTTYFISKEVADNDDTTLDFIISIIKNMIYRYLEKEFGIYNFDQLYEKIYEEAAIELSQAKLIFSFYDTIFTILDSVIGLKYNDMDKVCSRVYENDDYEKDGIDIIYNNAITIPRSESADREAFKQFFNHI